MIPAKPAPARTGLRIFLTGASGFLGGRIARLLQTQGHAVLALARSAAAVQAVRAMQCTAVPGDLEDIDTVDLHGIDVVVHAAAPVVFWGPWSLYQQQIVDASLALYRHAAAQGVRRFVFISSESVLQGDSDLLDIDARHPFADPPNSFYGQAKKAAEKALGFALRQTPACELVILRPTFIWAPDAPAVAQIKHRMRQGQFVWIDGGRRPFEAVHVENVARAVLAALTRGRSGAAYLVTDGRPYTARQLIGTLVRQGPDAVVPPRWSLPAGLVRPLANTLDRLWRALGRWHSAPPVSAFDAAFLGQSRRYDIRATLAELDYRPAAVDPQRP